MKFRLGQNFALGILCVSILTTTVIMIKAGRVEQVKSVAEQQQEEEGQQTQGDGAAQRSEMCKKSPQWTSMGRNIVGESRGRILFVAFMRLEDPVAERHLKSLQELCGQHLTDVKFVLVVPFDQPESVYRHWYKRLISKNFLLIKDSRSEQIRRLLNAGDRHFFIYDRCSRLSYHHIASSDESHSREIPINEALKSAIQYARCGWCQYDSNRAPGRDKNEDENVARGKDVDSQRSVSKTRITAYMNPYERQKQEQIHQRATSGHTSNRQQSGNEDQRSRTSYSNPREDDSYRIQSNRNTVDPQYQERERLRRVHLERERMEALQRREEQQKRLQLTREQQQQRKAERERQRVRQEQVDKQNIRTSKNEKTPARNVYGGSENSVYDIPVSSAIVVDDYYNLSPDDDDDNDEDENEVKIESKSEKSEVTETEKKTRVEDFDEMPESLRQELYDAYDYAYEQEFEIEPTAAVQEQIPGTKAPMGSRSAISVDNVPCSAYTDKVCFEQQQLMGVGNIHRCCHKGLYLSPVCIPQNCINETRQLCCLQKFIQARYHCCHSEKLTGEEPDEFSRCCYADLVERDKDDPCCPGPLAGKYWSNKTSLFELCLPNVNVDFSDIRITATLYDGAQASLDLGQTSLWKYDCPNAGKRSEYFYYQPPKEAKTNETDKKHSQEKVEH